MDEKSWDGQWWLPQTPAEKVPGTLTVDEDGRLRLALIGALDSHLSAGEAVTEGGTTTVSFTERSMERAGVYPRILGHAGNDAFTLEDCFQTRRSSSFFGGMQFQHILVAQVLKGVWFEPGEALEFSKIYAWMDGLAYWVLESGLEESVEFTKAEDGLEHHSATTLRIASLPLKTCGGQDGATISLGQTYGVAGDSIVERRLTQDFYFSVSFDRKQPLTTLLDHLSDLQDLVSIGTGNAAAFSAISLRHPDIVRNGEGKSYDMPIDMLANWQLKSVGSRKLMHHEMFFSLPDLGGIDGVEQWLAISAKHRSSLGRVMATKYSPEMIVSDRVLNCAAALEAYDRNEHGDKVTFATRIERSTNKAGEIFERLVGDVEAWIAALKKARNDVAHHKTTIGASTEHYFLADSAYWLFVLCILSDASAPPALFDHMAQHQRYRWLQRRLDEVLAGAMSNGSLT